MGHEEELTGGDEAKQLAGSRSRKGRQSVSGGTQ